MKNRIGVYICQCGSNISDYVDVEQVKEYAEKVDGVVLAKITMFACADSTQKEMVEDINSEKLDALVVASCSPKLHLETFRNVAIRAGLNPYNYIQVNIREQGSWAHSDKPKEATEKAIGLVNASIARVKHSEALEPINIPSVNTVVVIGAGISGMRAAIDLADMGSQVYIIEKEYFVGGRVSQWDDLFTTDETGREVITRMYQRIMTYENITLFTGAQIVSKTGSVGAFNIKLEIKPRYIKPDCKIDPVKLEQVIDACPVEVEDDFNFNLTNRKAIYKNYPSEFPEIPAIDAYHCTKCGICEDKCEEVDFNQKTESIEIQAGAVLLSTGFDPYEPNKGDFGFEENDYVITLQQLKRLIEITPGEFIFRNRKIEKIAYIYCVGSRQSDGPNKYCSRYCCTSAIHTGILLKNKYPGIKNLHFNRGIRTYGKQELLYHEASENGDVFLQFEEDSPPEVSTENGQLKIKVEDILTARREVETSVDLVVLVTGMVPRKDNSVADIFKVPIGRDKFFNEIHPKLRPVETVIDGILISGACQGPKNIPESANSALSAASKANALISKGSIEIEPKLAEIDETNCEWCNKCMDICPYDAILKKDVNGKQVAEVNEANCKGCGMCLPVCSSNSIDLIGFTDVEMESMIDVLALNEIS